MGVNIVLFMSPFWLLMQTRSIFFAVGGIVAIIGGVGEMPENWLTSFLKMVLGSLSFLNLDISATRPGCGGTPSTFVPVYWGNLNLMLGYALPSLAGLPCFYFFTRLITNTPIVRSLAPVRALFTDWHDPEWYRNRIFCAMIFWLDMSWMILVRNSIQGIVPGPIVEGAKRLYKAPNQKYLEEGHTSIFVASFIVIPLCVIVLPITLISYLRKEMAGAKAHRHPDSLFKIGIWYASLNDITAIQWMSLDWTLRFVIAMRSLLGKFPIPNVVSILTLQLVCARCLNPCTYRFGRRLRGRSRSPN